MSMTVTVIKQELQIDQEIDEKLNELLKQQKEWIDESEIWKSELDVHQLQNLLSVAHETNSVEVVKNFILYQLGRDAGKKEDKKRSWQWRWKKKGPFGQELLAEIEELRKRAVGIAQATKSPNSEIDKIWIKLTRVYLGYLRRYFFYKKREWEAEKEEQKNKRGKSS